MRSIISEIIGEGFMEANVQAEAGFKVANAIVTFGNLQQAIINVEVTITIGQIFETWESKTQ